MTSWFFITNDENWNVISKENVIGLPSYMKNVLDKAKMGDKCLIYITKKMIIQAIYEITQISPKLSIKWVKGVFPNLMKLKPIKIFQKPIPIRDHLKNLKMISNQKNWPICIRRSRRILDEDINYILNL
jgi:predicted RNA-binding protein